MKDLEDMSEEEREEYFEKLGIEPQKVEEQETEEKVHIVEKSEEGEGKEEERRKEELEQYRETSGF
ncbi:hypothetical protein AKJ37_02225 [candidate division MSBL1 archaeon SCGC-AAA259I09]|uniref:Uncharacterized protein n=2 Tax=candidate division MSBL1 TaxID=215777 RepID=A0A133UUH0_9EURY|nr:hypothetical protein AKJ61_04535 [candidate division MSBL1 archaeon SCGC-AAA259B11]KXA97863.1 hypothetical protein AKJ37_02225 [candidate division MSBL1 archaeon SCGC-AAA259I09]